jgi:hypothetical protein
MPSHFLTHCGADEPGLSLLGQQCIRGRTPQQGRPQVSDRTFKRDGSADRVLGLPALGPHMDGDDLPSAGGSDVQLKRPGVSGGDDDAVFGALRWKLPRPGGGGSDAAVAMAKFDQGLAPGLLLWAG